MHRYRWTLTVASIVLALALVSGALAAAAGSASPMILTPAGRVSQPPVDPGFPQGDGPWVVRAYFTNREMIARLVVQLEPWEVNHDEGYLVVRVDRDQFQWMRTLGFRLEVDQALTDQINRPAERLPGQVNGIPGYPCYRTVEETYATALNLANTYPSLAEWVDIGDTWEKVTAGGNPGYDLMVLRITNDLVPGPKPKLFVMGSIHAREYAPAELVTRFAEHLLQNYNVDPDVTWLLDYHEIHLLLQANPDGRKMAETGLAWRKNTNNNYCSGTSTRGADLNRNFEFQWGCCLGSSGDPCSEVYRGPSPGSEPETQAVQNYVRSQFPDQRDDALTSPAPADATGVFLDLHSYGRLVLWPWGFTFDVAPNGTALQTLGRKFAFFNGYTPSQSIDLYPTDGTTDDFAYGELGLAGFTFELGTAFFQNCTTFEGTIVPENMRALIYAAKAARTPYLTPAGPDARNLSATPPGVNSGEGVQLGAIIDDTRFSNSGGSEPAQNIVAAEYYIDVPPWETNSTPIAYPMAASDGNFNATIEAVSAILDTTGLIQGRHTVYIRGRDASGNWGAVSAVFITVYTTPQASFSSNSPVVLGQPVQFTNLTTGTPPLSYRWDFGDDVGVSTANDPSYTYAALGAYTVTLTATNTLGTDSVTQTVYIEPCVDISAISLTLATTGTYYTGDLVNLRLDLAPEAATKPYTYTLKFDDGSPPITATSSSDPFILSHAFASPGVHEVQVSAWNQCMLAPVTDSLITTIAERHGATILPSPSVEFGDPGELVTHTLRLTNIGDTPDIFTLTLETAVWETSLSTSTFSLEPGSAVDFNILVEVPVSALSGDEDSVQLNAASLYPAAPPLQTSIITTAADHFAVLAITDPQEQTGYPGDTVLYHLNIQNLGNTGDVFDIQVSGNAWSTIADAESIALSSGETHPVSVSVTIPARSSGKADTAALTVSSQGDSAVQTSVIITTRASWRLVLPAIFK